jgi:transcriptional regulator with XRE-family HTH domain
MDRHLSRGHGGSVSPASVGAPDLDAAEFAEYLRAERERRRLTIEQVAEETKIASRHLAALERGDVRNWPGGMYRRAMMRAYAESIGVDREFALKQFEQAFDAPPPHVDPPPARIEPRRPALQWRPTRGRARAAGASVLTIVAALIVWKVATSLATSDGEVAGTGTPVAAVSAAPAVQPAHLQTTASTPRAREPLAAVAISARETAATTGAIPSRPLATEGALVVESTPPGARVTVNGVGWGETPVTIRHLEFGSKRIRLTLQDHVSEERMVNLGPERPNSRVRLALRER